MMGGVTLELLESQEIDTKYCTRGIGSEDGSLTRDTLTAACGVVCLRGGTLRPHMYRRKCSGLSGLTCTGGSVQDSPASHVPEEVFRTLRPHMYRRKCSGLSGLTCTGGSVQDSPASHVPEEVFRTLRLHMYRRKCSGLSGLTCTGGSVQDSPASHVPEEVFRTLLCF
ncbi:hypothetical protein VZT92_000023 [Zoarces viviparus]|uniref:Uncharacterized protein n=1 Tax=Zoarces viviparus TaxID=48416 RepID=A0AAW1G4B0_ZOAVI